MRHNQASQFESIILLFLRCIRFCRDDGACAGSIQLVRHDGRGDREERVGGRKADGGSADEERDHEDLREHRVKAHNEVLDDVAEQLAKLLEELKKENDFKKKRQHSLRRKSISSVPVHPEISTDIWGQMAS